VREYPTDTGPADYVLFVKREAVGVIEAKRDYVNGLALGGAGCDVSEERYF